MRQGASLSYYLLGKLSYRGERLADIGETPGITVEAIGRPPRRMRRLITEELSA